MDKLKKSNIAVHRSPCKGKSHKRTKVLIVPKEKFDPVRMPHGAFVKPFKRGGREYVRFEYYIDSPQMVAAQKQSTL